MLITLYGPDSYRRQSRAKYLVSKYQAKHTGLSLSYFDLSSSDLDSELARLKSFCSTQSLFETIKLGLIKNVPSSASALKKIILPKLEDRSTTLILLMDKKPNKDFSFLLQPPAQSEEFANLSGSALLNFVSRLAQDRQLSLSPATLKTLVAGSGNDLWGIVNELDRLALLPNSDFSPSTLSQLGLFNSYDFFFLIKNLSHSDLGKRLSSLFLLLSQGEDPAKIFNFLAYSPSVNQRTSADLDLDIKSGRLEYSQALLSLVISK